MSASTSTQRQKLAEFLRVANCRENVAVKFLEAAGWNVRNALDAFFDSPSASAPAANLSKVVALYDAYKDPNEPGKINMDGVGRFCRDIGLDPTDIVALVMAQHLNASHAAEFTRREFVEGFAALGLDSLDAIRAKLPAWRKELDDPERFRAVYNFAFGYSKESSSQKGLSLEVVIPLLQLLLAGRFALLDEWCEFLETKYKRPLNKDTWTMVLEFSRTIDADLSNYDEDGAWPTVMDDFVAYIKQKRSA